MPYKFGFTEVSEEAQLIEKNNLLKTIQLRTCIATIFAALGFCAYFITTKLNLGISMQEDAPGMALQVANGTNTILYAALALGALYVLYLFVVGVALIFKEPSRILLKVSTLFYALVLSAVMLVAGNTAISYLVPDADWMWASLRSAIVIIVFWAAYFIGFLMNAHLHQSKEKKTKREK